MSLIERLEKAEAGSRELDAEIHTAATGEAASKDAWGHWCKGDPSHWEKHVALDLQRFEVPHYTTSLDAALRLVPDGLWFSVGSGREYTATIYADRKNFDAKGATLALALCIAALKARSTP